MFMSISGVSGAASGADLINTRVMASIKVLDMAMDTYEDVAGELIDSMSSIITGLGQNIDMTV